MDRRSNPMARQQGQLELPAVGRGLTELRAAQVSLMRHSALRQVARL